MAEFVFALPDLGEGLEEATILEWRVSEGDFVERNSALVEVETSKSAVEVPSPRAGKIVRLHADAADVVRVGAPLVAFAVDDDQAGIVGTVPAEPESARRVRLRAPED